ncbi:MAG: 2-oxo acid dehydrogenase subunit E2 [Chloroflexi bacterium]|nr:2-oxo acid dehydrogenase subunit E2 [Chloroflexota bacterium]
MATEVRLPQWGMNMEDGLLVKWLVKEGDEIEAGQPLVEIETAKINSELEAPTSGVVAHIMQPEGTTVDVGTLVAVITEPGETVPRPEPAERRRRVGAPRRERRREAPGRQGRSSGQVTPVARRLASQNDIDLSAVRGTGPNDRITEDDVRQAMSERESVSSGPTMQVVPRARLLARQNGIDLGRVNGSGPSGRIVVADVERAIAEAGAVSEVVPLRGLRKTIAERMVRSAQTMAQVTLTTEADVTEMVRLREALVSQWRQARIRPLDLDIILKAVAAALKENPRLNATLVNDEIRLMRDVNVGVAMAVPDGLLVPVVGGADEKDLLTVAKEVRELADRCRKGELSLDDMSGASFTITSLANYDIDAFTPIIDPPQVAILGVGRVVEKPAVVDGEIAVRSMMYLSLAFDHRALDGVPAGEFLRTVKSKLEDPSWMSGPADSSPRPDES